MGFPKRRKRRHLDSASAGKRAKHLRPPYKTLAEVAGQPLQRLTYSET